MRPQILTNRKAPVHPFDALAETMTARSGDDVVVNITITDSRGFVHHYGEIVTDNASARAALTVLSRRSGSHPTEDPR